MKRIGIAIIGTGLMGSIHAQVCAENADAKLVGVADISETRAREIARRYGAKGYTDYHELLRRPDVDAAIVATPDDLHKEPVLAACDRGLDILLEKPIATSLADADAIIDAVKKAHVKLMLGFTLRFDANYVKVKQAIESGVLGKIIWSYARRNAIIAEAERHATHTTPTFYCAIHDIDVISWYVKDTVREVYATSARGKIYEKYGVPDFTWILTKFQNGAVGSIESGWGLNNNFASYQKPEEWWPLGGDIKLEVVGTEGSTYVDIFPSQTYAVDNQGWKYVVVDYVGSPYYGRIRGARAEEDAHFIRCVAQDIEPIVTGEDGRIALEVVLAANDSIRSGQPKRLPA